MLRIVAEAVTSDRRALPQAAFYHGGILLASSGGASIVSVYDGHDTTGVLIDRFDVQASQFQQSFYERGIALRRGLYVDLGSNVSAFTLYYSDQE